MKDLTITLILLLLCSGVVIYKLMDHIKNIERDDKLHEIEFQNYKTEALAKVTARDSAISTLQAQKDSVIVSARSEQKVFKSTITALKKRRVGGPVVQDTIIVYLDSLVASIEQERDTVFAIDQQLTDSLQRSVNELSEMFSGQLRESIRLQGQLDRERKKRFVIGPAIGIDYRGNATISFGATYQLWRF
jgi:hypothetical protein